MAKKHANVSFIEENPFDALFSEPKIAPTEKELELVQSSGEDTVEIEVSQLKDYHNHTYKILDNEDMSILVDSIKDYGILLPLLVRKDGDEYEIVSGHRRKFAAQKLGIDKVPCKILDIGDDMADIVMADTNIARETILPSEKAKTYKVRMEAAIRMGKKTEEELKLMADESPDSLSSIRRYMKLNNLTPLLLDKVDEGRIPVIAGVMLADLSKKNLNIVTDVVKESNIYPSLKDAEKLKKANTRGLTKDAAYEILTGALKPRTTKRKVTFSEKPLLEVVPDEIKKLPLSERIEYYKKAIKAYKE